MKFYPPSASCQNCSCHINQEVLQFSLDKYAFALCIPCQRWLDSKKAETTDETISLYFSLRKRNIGAVLEKFDGYKTIDIAVTEAKLNIEVDGRQHNTNPKQAFSDLQRTYYALKKGYFTLRIPNTLVREKLEDTADYISHFVAVTMQRNAHT